MIRRKMSSRRKRGRSIAQSKGPRDRTWFAKCKPLTDQLEVTRRLKMNGLIATGINDFEVICPKLRTFVDVI